MLDGSITEWPEVDRKYIDLCCWVWLQPPLWALLLVKTYQGSRTLSYVCVQDFSFEILFFVGSFYSGNVSMLYNYTI